MEGFIGYWASGKSIKIRLIKVTFIAEMNVKIILIVTGCLTYLEYLMSNYFAQYVLKRVLKYMSNGAVIKFA